MTAPSTAIVCIDPGHPSEVGPGASGPAGIREMHLNWVVALRLRELLEAEGLRVVLTKGAEGETVSNRRRAEIANEAEACLLLRLHCDDRPDRGTATYYPDREGTAQGHTGPSAEVRARSGEAARVFHPAMVAALGAEGRDLGVHGDRATSVGARQGALTGSIFSRVPALTIEMVSVTDRRDAEWLASEDGCERMARALAAGVRAWISHTGA